VKLHVAFLPALLEQMDEAAVKDGVGEHRRSALRYGRAPTNSDAGFWGE
jgi:hypothetical protein